MSLNFANIFDSHVSPNVRIAVVHFPSHLRFVIYTEEGEGGGGLDGTSPCLHAFHNDISDERALLYRNS